MLKLQKSLIQIHREGRMNRRQLMFANSLIAIFACTLSGLAVITSQDEAGATARTQPNALLPCPAPLAYDGDYGEKKGHQGNQISIRYCDRSIKQITSGERQVTARDPAWTPNNKEIYYRAEAVLGHPYIEAINASGGAPRRITPAGFDAEQPVISTTKLAFVRPVQFGASKIYVSNRDGSGIRRLTNTGSGIVETEPAWRPDGRKIAYISYNLKSSSIEPILWTRNTNGAVPRRLTWQGGHPTTPTWTPDGKYVLYARLSGHTSNIYTTLAEKKSPEIRVTSVGSASEYTNSPTVSNNWRMAFLEATARTGPFWPQVDQQNLAGGKSEWFFHPPAAIFGIEFARVGKVGKRPPGFPPKR